MSKLDDYKNCLADHFKKHQVEIKQISDILTNNLTKSSYNSTREIHDELQKVIPLELNHLGTLIENLYPTEFCLKKIATPAKLGEGYDDVLISMIKHSSLSSLTYKQDSNGFNSYYVLLKASDTNNFFVIDNEALNIHSKEELEQLYNEEFRHLLDKYVLVDECNLVIHSLHIDE